MNPYGMSDKDLEDLRQSFLRNKKGIGDSDLFFLMFNDNGKQDALQCLQLGIAIMMDKPIIVMADDAAKLPKNLARLAVKVKRADIEDPQKFALAVKEIQEELGEKA